MGDLVYNQNANAYGHQMPTLPNQTVASSPQPLMPDTNARPVPYFPEPRLPQIEETEEPIKRNIVPIYPSYVLIQTPVL
jgi:hypothetical protein